MGNFLRPLDFECTIGQGFAQNANEFYRSNGLRGHTGVDESCGYGSPIHSYVSGEVIAVYTPENPAGDGFTAVYILCKTPLETFEFSVGHCSKIHVKVGDVVKEGDHIADEGNKGVVYSGGQRITRSMQANGDKRGSHRHVQKRVLRASKEMKRYKAYLRNAGGVYSDKDGNYYELVDYTNGYHGCVDFTKPLWRRDLFQLRRGYDVELLQRALVLQGYADFEPTGYFGNLTRQALAKFQKEAGLTPSVGYCGRLTRRVLNSIYNQLT